jgi:hypothetical protein
MRLEISPGKMLEAHILSNRLGMVVHTSNTTVYKVYVHFSYLKITKAQIAGDMAQV